MRSDRGSRPFEETHMEMALLLICLQLYLQHRIPLGPDLRNEWPKMRNGSPENPV